MANGRFVAYYRVSTATQGQSGLGLEAQREAVARFLSGGNWELVDEFQEVETGKGADALAKRPRLKAALDTCRKHSATLIIAKLDSSPGTCISSPASWRQVVISSLRICHKQTK